MHELSISSAILDTVLRHAEGRPVSAVEMRIGRLRQVVPDSLGFYLEIVSRGTLCEGAELRIEAVDALMRCAGCGHEWDPAPRPAESVDELMQIPQFRCPACAEGGAEVVRGEELEVDAIMVSESPAATG